MKYPYEQTSVIKMKKQQLDRNKHKGDSWMTCYTSFLFQKLHEEYAEVILNPFSVEELADLANIVDMLIWRYSI